MQSLYFFSFSSQEHSFFPLAWRTYYSLSLQIQVEFSWALFPQNLLLPVGETARTLKFSIETNIVSLLSEDFVLLVHKSLALGHRSEMLYKY